MVLPVNITLLMGLAANHEAFISAECFESSPNWLLSGSDLSVWSRRSNSESLVVCRVEMGSTSSRKRSHLTHELIIIPEEIVENSTLLIRTQKVKRKPTGVRAKPKKK